MTNTEFIMRNKMAEENPLLKATRTRIRLVDGVIALVVLAVFVGLVLLLAK